MKREIKLFLVVTILLFSSVITFADETPTINPTVTYTTPEGDIVSSDTTASAPITGMFRANASNIDGYTANYEWRFYNPGSEDSPYLIRYDENTEYTFTSSGTSYIVLYATFTKDTVSISFTKDYWHNDATPLKITIPESKLEVPNAFSPNGDGINDIFKVKDGYQSLTEFHAYIFNRWGQKLYEWSDPALGWDGKYNGKDVKQGVYFVLIKAKGADGINYNIKRDVNLLRGFTESGSSSSTGN